LDFFNIIYDGILLILMFPIRRFSYRKNNGGTFCS
jgi:hypothetical protein